MNINTITIKDIARRLGISVSTVSKGLNGATDISRELRHAVINTAIEMGYAAKRVQNSSHSKLCVFLKKTDYEPEIRFGFEIISGFQQAAAYDGREVTIIPYPVSHKIPITYDAYMLKHGFSGAFFVGVPPEDDWVKQFSATVIPTAFLGACRSSNTHVCQIGTDLFDAVDMGISYLMSLNHKKIAFLNDTENPAAPWLQNAYAACSSLYGFAPDNLYACTEPSSPAVGDCLRRFFQAGATAVICGSDPLARTVIRKCSYMGLSVPREVSVIGFGNFASSALALPPLTTISPDLPTLGKGSYYALSSLFRKIPVKTTLLRAVLILRDSAAPCKP